MVTESPRSSTDSSFSRRWRAKWVEVVVCTRGETYRYKYTDRCISSRREYREHSIGTGPTTRYQFIRGWTRITAKIRFLIRVDLR